MSVAAVGAVAVHAVFWALSLPHPGSMESWAASLADKIHERLGREHTIDVAPPPPPVRRPEPSKPRIVQDPKHHAAKQAAAPAKASTVITREIDPNAPVDLTADTFVTGGADAYAGGSTTKAGTSDVAVHADDLSRGVSLGAQNWSCPWPVEADAEQIREQIVVISVTVSAGGSAELVKIITDPGHGFAQAATDCAKQTAFEPALDATGKPIRSQSPPLRVRFTR